MSNLPATGKDRSKREGRVGLWLSLSLGLAILALGSMVMVSSAQRVKARFVEHNRTHDTADVSAAVTPAARSQRPATLPGFQARGNSLVGEFTTREGSEIRLVIDAKSQKVIGARLIRQGDAAGR